MEIVKLLAGQLGISEEQAQGGAGLLFKLAQDKLGSGDFSQLTELIPDIGSLASSAPSGGGGLAGALGGLASSFGGGKLGNLGDLAKLAGGFKSLNLDSEMITKFIPIVLSFVQEKGGDSLKDILAKVVTADS